MSFVDVSTLSNNLVLSQASSNFSQGFTVKPFDSFGFPVDLTGWGAWGMDIYSSTGNSSLSTVASLAPNTVYDTTGESLLELTGTMLAGLPSGTFVYNLFRANPSSTNQLISAGALAVR